MRIAFILLGLFIYSSTLSAQEFPSPAIKFDFVEAEPRVSYVYGVPKCNRYGQKMAGCVIEKTDPELKIDCATSKIQFIFHTTDLNILLSTDYPVGSCEYNEMLQYVDSVIDARVSTLQHHAQNISQTLLNLYDNMRLANKSCEEIQQIVVSEANAFRKMIDEEVAKKIEENQKTWPENYCSQ